jgi:hypothetical protein
MRRAGTPMTAREIADALIADKAPQATRKQATDLQAAILVACGSAMAGRWSVMARPRVGDWSPTEAGWGSFFLPSRIWPVFSLSFSSLFPCVFK